MKKLAIWFLGYCLVVLLLVTANGVVFTQVTSKADKVKQIIASSGAYEATAPLVIDELIARNALNTGPFSLENEAPRRLAEQVLSGERVQAVVEPIIGGMYAWLNGETQVPEFAVNLSSTRDALAGDFTNYQIERISKLPPCETGEVTNAVSVLSLQCKPALALDEASIKQAVEQYLKENGGILNQKLDARELDLAQGQQVYEQIKQAPANFQAAQWLPWITGVLALLCAAGIYWLSTNRSKALFYLAITLGVSAVTLAVLPTVNSFLIEQVLSGTSQINASASVPLQLVLQTFNDSSAYIYYWGAGLSLLAGGGLLGVRHYLDNRSVKA